MDSIRLMTERSAGAVAITEGTRLTGIFTERDVMKKIVLAGLDANKTRLSDVMTTSVASIPETASASEALTLMSERRFRHLPVVNAGGEILGMLSLRYLLHDRLEDTFNELRSLEAYMTADGPGG
jgi:CBS domain-containing protein